jgi:hypothetical protein
MSSQRRENSVGVVASGRGIVGVGGVVSVIDVVGVGCLVLVLSVGVIVRGRRRGSQTPAVLRAVPPLEARALWWVRRLLPGDEGTAWCAR